MAEHILVLNTCPDHEIAMSLAEMLVDSNLAGCVNILPTCTSIFKWKGKMESAQEHILLIKTTSERYKSLEQKICENHPYELPEIIAVPITAGLPEYLLWIKNINDNN